MRETYASETGAVVQADLFELAAYLAPGSVDMILDDLPYGTTQNKWDSVIPFEPMWKAFKRALKPGGAIVLTAQSPFSHALAMSNIRELRTEWAIEKANATGHLNSAKQPMKAHEVVLVFCESVPAYYPQKLKDKAYKRSHPRRSADPAKRSNYKGSANYGAEVATVTENEGVREPRTVLHGLWDALRIDKAHPTQKPVELFEYMIRTYSTEGAVIADFTAGAGTTAIAARNTGRSFIVGDSGFVQGDSGESWADEIALRLAAPDDRTWAREAKARRAARVAA